MKHLDWNEKKCCSVNRRRNKTPSWPNPRGVHSVLMEAYDNAKYMYLEVRDKQVQQTRKNHRETNDKIRDPIIGCRQLLTDPYTKSVSQLNPHNAKATRYRPRNYSHRTTCCYWLRRERICGYSSYEQKMWGSVDVSDSVEMELNSRCHIGTN